MTAARVADILAGLRLTVLERGWLSSNNVVLAPADGGPVTVVDTGYDTHAAQTVNLLQRAAGEAGVARVVNTHLHSDHCGGNAALQARWACETWVPAVSLEAVRTWDAARLTYALTDQRCERFNADRGVEVGEVLHLAGEPWRALQAPGHDPEALMYWHEASRVLIAGDALWEGRLAIIFPELHGRDGFAGAAQVLDTIEALAPAVVIPGHGRPFGDVASALHRSRARLAQFQSDPKAHLGYAARALTMFHMLEHRRVERAELVAWLAETPVFRQLLPRWSELAAENAATEVIDRLVSDGALAQSAGQLHIATD